MTCTNCKTREAKPTSRKGYCGECQSAAIDGWHSKMEATNAKREEQRNRVRKIIKETEAAAELAAFQESELKHTLSAVVIKPATCDIALYLKNNKYPIQRPKSGGMRLLPPTDIKVTQSWRWAKEYALRLADLGYNAVADIIEVPQGGPFNG